MDRSDVTERRAVTAGGSGGWVRQLIGTTSGSGTEAAATVRKAARR